MRRAYSRHYGWAGMAVLAGLLLPVVRSGAAAAQAMQTFGPGQVNCEALGGTQVDCLLAAGLVTPDNSNVATFSVGVLPQDEQALFRRWCVATANECTVTVTGRTESPQSSRLVAVTSIRWTRLSPPLDQAAARLASRTGGGAARPAP